MAEQSKAAQRSTLILQLGRLLAPIYELAERSAPPTSVDYRVTAASFRPDLDKWNNGSVAPFVIVGGYRFGHEQDDIVHELYLLAGALATFAREPGDPAAIQLSLRDRLKRCQEVTLEAIERVPIEWEARLFESRTPFTVYMHIRDAINTAKTRVHYFDRYLDTDFFHLYLRNLARTLQIRLVTTQGNATFGVSNVRAVSALAGVEFSDYKLIECHHSDLHDRNLRIDDQVFFLGPSINAAGTHPTNFSPTDSSAAAHAVLDAIIAKGSVIT